MAGILILSLKGRYYPSNWCEISYMIVFLDKRIFQEIWNTGQYNKCVSCHCDSRKCQRKGLHKFHTWYLHLLVFKTLLHQTVIYFLTVILVLRIYHTSEQCLSCVLIGQFRSEQQVVFTIMSMVLFVHSFTLERHNIDTCTIEEFGYM